MSGDVGLSLENVWFPDDQHGYSIALCECDGGPYLGARRMGTPCVCETCRRITPEQWDFLVSHAKAEALQEAADYVTPKNWTGPNGTLLHLNHWLAHKAAAYRSPTPRTPPTSTPTTTPATEPAGLPDERGTRDA